MAQSIVFDEGYKEYTINNDPERIIRVATGDIAFITRADEASKNIAKFMDKYGDVKLKADGTAEVDDEEAVQSVREIQDYVCEQIDYMFNAKVSDIVFNGASPLATLKGIALYERFINAFMPIIKKDLKDENKAAQQRMAKYEKQAARFKKRV